MRKKVLFVTAGLLILLCAQGAFAAFLEFTGNFKGPTDVTNQLINVSKFNPSLGTLLSANFELSATMNTSLTVANDGDFYAGWDKLDYNFSLIGDTGYSSIAISASNSPVRIVGTGNPDGSFTPFGEYAQIIGQQPWTQTGPILTALNSFSPVALAGFIGSGDLSFFLTTLNWDAFSVMATQSAGEPPNFQSLSTDISSHVKVTYDYTPVPIPGAILLLGSGLAGFIGLRKIFSK